MVQAWGGDGASEGGAAKSLRGRSVGSERNETAPKGFSGRLFVILGCLIILVVWGVVYLAFLGWRSRYEELAAFGRMEVAASVDPLAKLQPSNVESQAWSKAVADTRTMLIGLTSAGLLGKKEMIALRDDLHDRVARAQAYPDNARDVLGKLWDDMEDRAGPVISSNVVPVDPNSRHAKRIARPARPGGLPARGASAFSPE